MKIICYLLILLTLPFSPKAETVYKLIYPASRGKVYAGPGVYLQQCDSGFIAICEKPRIDTVYIIHPSYAVIHDTVWRADAYFWFSPSSYELSQYLFPPAGFTEVMVSGEWCQYNDWTDDPQSFIRANDVKFVAALNYPIRTRYNGVISTWTKAPYIHDHDTIYIYDTVYVERCQHEFEWEYYDLGGPGVRQWFYGGPDQAVRPIKSFWNSEYMLTGNSRCIYCGSVRTRKDGR